MRNLFLLLFFCILSIVSADVLLLKDGSKVVGEVADKGDNYEVKTKHGVLSVKKDEVQKIVKDPAGIACPDNQGTFREILIRDVTGVGKRLR